MIYELIAYGSLGLVTPGWNCLRLYSDQQGEMMGCSAVSKTLHALWHSVLLPLRLAELMIMHQNCAFSRSRLCPRLVDGCRR